MMNVTSPHVERQNLPGLAFLVMQLAALVNGLVAWRSSWAVSANFSHGLALEAEASADRIPEEVRSGRTLSARQHRSGVGPHPCRIGEPVAWSWRRKVLVSAPAVRYSVVGIGPGREDPRAQVNRPGH